MRRPLMGRPRPRLVELVGPAGAGKSTLASALPSVDPGLANGPAIWGLPRWRLAASAMALLPLFLKAALQGHPVARAEMAQMIRLDALRRAVQHTGHDDGQTILMDEGPVFGLTWLEVFYANGHDATRTRWRRKALVEWAVLLDAVVRVDADDNDIARRIRSRAKPHMVKNLPDHEIQAFTDRFREAFDRIIALMEACGHVTVHSVPSTHGRIDDDAARVRDAIVATINGR